MDILVTGGAGFIGSHLVDELVGLGHKVTALDNLSTGNWDNVVEGCERVTGDIRDSLMVDKCVSGKDVVFHLAAYTSVPGSIDDPTLCLAVNVDGTRNLIEASRMYKVKRFVFSSSSAVYPDFPNSPRAENTPPDPKSPYAQSKLEGESLLKRYHQETGFGYAGLRYFNVYGARQDAESDYAAVIPIFIKKARKNENLTIYGDGRQTRDFVYVTDVVRANLLVMESPHPGIFNVGTAKAISIEELANSIIMLTGSEAGYSFEPPRPGDVFTSTADISLIRSSVGWRPEWDLPVGLHQTMSSLSPSLEALKQ